MNFAVVLEKDGESDDVICKNGDVCAEGVACVAWSTGKRAKMIPVGLKMVQINLWMFQINEFVMMEKQVCLESLLFGVLNNIAFVQQVAKVGPHQ